MIQGYAGICRDMQGYAGGGRRRRQEEEAGVHMYMHLSRAYVYAHKLLRTRKNILACSI